MKEIVNKGTIYIAGLAGYRKIEATDIHFELVSFAQYKNAVQLTFKPKRKRLIRRIQEGYEPRIVVLDVWGHPDPPSAFTISDPGIKGIVELKTFTMSKEAFEENDINFNTFMEKYKAKILIDTRGFKPETK